MAMGGWVGGCIACQKSAYNKPHWHFFRMMLIRRFIPNLTTLHIQPLRCSIVSTPEYAPFFPKTNIIDHIQCDPSNNTKFFIIFFKVYLVYMAN